MRYIKSKKVKPVSNDFTVYFDDRERDPWLFISDYWTLERKRLKVGDYTIQGLENKFTLEKKSGLLEILTNLSAPNRKRFERFLEKLSTYPVKCIIVEEPLTNSGIYSALKILHKKSKGKSRLTASTIYYWTAAISVKYNIPIIFVDKPTLKHIVVEVIKAAYRKAQEL